MMKPVKKVVELRNGPAHGRRTEIIEGTSGVNIPVLGPGGFGLVTYRPSGLRAFDGTEIWTLQEWSIH